MNTFYKACKSCFSNRKLFQPFASITWQEEKRNVDEMEVTTTTKRYKSLALSFFTFLRLLYVFLFWAPVLWMLLMDSKDRSLLSCMSPPLEHTFLFAIWVCLFVFELFFYFMASFFCFFFFCFLFHEFFILHFIYHLIYECLYNKLSYARSLIGSHLWSIGGQMYRWRHHWNFFLILKGCTSCPTFLFLPHFDVICDLLLNRRTATWNLFVNFISLNFVRWL